MTEALAFTPLLGMELLAEGQVRAWLSLNKSLDIYIDRWIQIVFEEQTGTPPVTPATNGVYAVASSGTSGAFVGHENEVAVYDGSDWTFFVPWEGVRAYDKDEDRMTRFNGTTWVGLGDLVDASGETNASMGTKLNDMIGRITLGGVLPGG